MKKKHKHYDLAYRAHYFTSFSPEKRAESYCAAFDHDIEQLKAANIPIEKIEKYESLWVKYMSAKGRCLSSMITGPANFPVRRAEKANNAAENAGKACHDYFNYLIDKAKKEKYYAENPNAKPVMAGDIDAIDRLKEKLASQIKAHETMKAVNVIVRKSPINNAALLELLGDQVRVDAILKPDYAGRIGFASYSLTNSNAEINRLKGRIKEIEARKSGESKELNIGGVKIIENKESMRLQLFFDGKPRAEIIALLKSHGFKWAPSVMAWQRQLTNNAIYSFNHFILKELKGVQS